MRKGAKTRPRIEFVIRESTKPVDHVSFVLSPSSLPPPSFCPLLYCERFNFASFVHILTAKRFFLLPFPFSFFFFSPSSRNWSPFNRNNRMHLLSVSLEFSRSDIFHDISRVTSIKIHSRIVVIFAVVPERQWIRGDPPSLVSIS